MPDIFTLEKRSQVMSLIRGKGIRTTELRLITLMRKSGIKGWMRNYPLLGKPDFTFPEQKLAVFVDGDFWHGHPKTYRAPVGNAEFWLEKDQSQQAERQEVTRLLKAKGWKIIRIWESSLKKARAARLTYIKIYRPLMSFPRSGA